MALVVGELKVCRWCGRSDPETRFRLGPVVQQARKKPSLCVPCTAQQERARRFGITHAELEKLMVGLCVLCEERPRYVVDHCHETGEVRGGLCRNCNSALGTLGDTPERLSRVVDYLRGQLVTA